MVASASRRIVNIALIGPPGSGKGTYGSLLAASLRSNLITAGDILRDHVTQQTAIGLGIQEAQRIGELADDELVNDAVLSYLVERQDREEKTSVKDNLDGEDAGPKLGFILDGFPRTLKQAQHTMNSFWPEPSRIHSAVSIDVPDEICITKMLGRRICRVCGGQYNVNGVKYNGFVMPPQEPDCPCDRDANWVKRDDDTEDIIRRRIDEFHVETAPIVRHYEGLGALIRFVPYKGVDDMHVLEELVRGWMKGFTLKER